jgi:hypothetical protein
MRRRKLGFWEASALGVSVALALIGACNVYDPSLLTGGPEGQGGTSAAGGEGSGGDSGTGATGGTGGSQGGSSGSSKGGTGGDGGTGATGGSTTGGTGGSSTGGMDPTGGDGGDPGTGGDAGSGAGSGGKGGTATGGTAGSGGSGGSGGSSGSAGSGGSGGNAGSGGACGKCGCGMPETDTDMDGTPDCIDTCVGYVDADCTALKNGLFHRYSFGGTGTAVTDTKGTAHGTAVNATLSGTGTLTLSGGNTSSPPYVNLPNGLLSTLTNATIEMWVTWNQSTSSTTGRDWQRIFDFGTSGTEDVPIGAGTGTMSYLFLTPRAGTSPTVLRAAYSTTGTAGETVASASSALATGTRQHIAVVVDDTNDELSLYLNGVRQSSVLFSGRLSLVSDVNNWLGRSQYSGDYEFIGVFDEFRIYNTALGTAPLRTSSTAGPNPAFLP